MRIPLPIGNVDDVEVHEPYPETIATCRKIGKQHPYRAMLHLVSKCTSLSEKQCKEAPFIDIEYLSVDILLLLHDDDKFEQVYECPTCKTMLKAFQTPEYDDRDSVSSLPVTMGTKEAVNEVETIELSNPVIIKAEGGEEGEIEVTEIQLRTLLMSDVLSSDSMDGFAASKAIVASQLVGDMDRSVKSTIVNKLSVRDLKKVNAFNERYGRQTVLPKTCTNCGKEWLAQIDTSSFFDLGQL